VRPFPNAIWAERLGRSSDQIGPTHTLALWQYTYNVTLTHVRATIVEVEKQ